MEPRAGTVSQAQSNYLPITYTHTQWCEREKSSSSGNCTGPYGCISPLSIVKKLVVTVMIRPQPRARIDGATSFVRALPGEELSALKLFRSPSHDRDDGLI